MSLPLATISPNLPSPLPRPTAAKRKGVASEPSVTPSSKLARAHSPLPLEIVIKKEHTPSPLQPPNTSLPVLNDPLKASISSSPAAIRRTASPLLGLPIWCDCGNCTEDAEESKGGKGPVCCLTVAVGRAITDDHEGICEGEAAERLLREGVCVADFMRFSPRVFTRAPRPVTWKECNNAQRRLMLYAAFHELVYGAGRKGQRDAMPECIKRRVREAYPREEK